MKKISLILLISLSAMISNLALADSIVRFDIDSNGKAHNISIVEASPARIFNSAVRVALKRSIFSTSNDSSASFERTYNFNLTANESDLANRFNFMEEAPQLAAN